MHKLRTGVNNIERQSDILCLLVKEYKTTVVLAKGTPLDLSQFWTQLTVFRNLEEHVELSMQKQKPA